MTIQERLKEKLKEVGLPHKQIDCYGSQIVITSHCQDTAEKWAGVLSKFATIKRVGEALDDAKENRNTSLLPTKVKVWRTFATL